MKHLKDTIFESTLIINCLDLINEEKDQIKLPYIFDLYNEGPKNKDFKISKANIYKIFFSVGKSEEVDKEEGKKVVKFIENYSQMIRLPLPADKITYKEIPNKENTKNWTEIPEINEYMWAGAWYSNKFKEYNYTKHNEDWNEWFTMIKPFMKGKISVTIDETGENNKLDYKTLGIIVNNEQFNKEREEKIKELKDPKNLEKWSTEADEKEKTEIKKQQEDELNKKKAADEWNKWWNSLSDSDKLAYTMGYNQSKYQAD